MAGGSATASGVFRRATRPAAPPPMPAMEETATFVLDEAETAPGQVESPSQISQGTVPIAAEGEETQPHMPLPRRTASSSEKMPSAEFSQRLVVAALIGIAVVAFAGLAVALFSWLK
jgi:hypothetical protein